MPGRPSPWNSRLRLRAREVRPSCECGLSRTGGITRASGGGAETTPRGSPSLHLRTRPRGVAGTPSSSTAAWRNGRCGQRCPSWPMTCPGSRRYVSPFSRVTSSFSGFIRSAQLVFCLSRSSRPGPSGSRCSFGGRGASGTSSVGRGSCSPTPTSLCRRGAWRRRISIFAVITGRLRWPRLRGRSLLWRRGSRS